MRTRKIYYLSTDVNTYMRRHDLYNTGVRWDAKEKRWWSDRKVPVTKAVEMLGSGTVVAAHVQKLPYLGKTFRGGRPRAPRKNGNGEGAHAPEGAMLAPVELTPPGAPPMAVSGAPFVRGRAGEDRRKNEGDRRNEGTRPDAVLVVPMAAEMQGAFQKE